MAAIQRNMLIFISECNNTTNFSVWNRTGHSLYPVRYFTVVMSIVKMAILSIFCVHGTNGVIITKPVPCQGELALQSLLVPAPPPVLRLLASLSHGQCFHGEAKGSQPCRFLSLVLCGPELCAQLLFLSPLLLLAFEKISCQIEDAKPDKSSALINSYSRPYCNCVLCSFLLTEVGGVSVQFSESGKINKYWPSAGSKMLVKWVFKWFK